MRRKPVQVIHLGVLANAVQHHAGIAEERLEIIVPNLGVKELEHRRTVVEAPADRLFEQLPSPLLIAPGVVVLAAVCVCQGIVRRSDDLPERLFKSRSVFRPLRSDLGRQVEYLQAVLRIERRIGGYHRQGLEHPGIVPQIVVMREERISHVTILGMAAE